MSFGLSGLLMIGLLVVAASLASLWFGQWSALRGNGRTLHWLIASAGAILLLIAAAIAVLSTGVLSRFGIFSSDQISDTKTGSRQYGSRPEATDSARQRATGTRETARQRFEPADRRRRDAEVEDSSGKPSTSVQQSRSAAPAPKSEAVATPVFNGADPWAATRCVTALRLNPDIPRWTIENDCGAAVGVLIATCSATAAQCDASGVAGSVWRYRAEPMLLPPKYLWPVTAAEQTVEGGQIHYEACYTTIPPVGEGRERAALHQGQDACLTLVQQRTF